MKKLFYAVALLLCTTSLSAGNAGSSKDEAAGEVKEANYYGASKGDFALSFSALPVINFVGNMFNGTTSQSFAGFSGLNASSFSGSTISGKYFMSDRMSLSFGAGFNCLNNTSYLYGEDNQTKENIKNTGSNEVMFCLGTHYLLRPGKRLQPVLGANLLYAFANKNFEKEDDRTEIDADTNHKTPSNSFGIVCNVGVEFFLSKAISLSATADLGLVRTTTRSKVNDWDEEYSKVTSRQTRFMTGKMGGNFAINFYF